MTKTKSLLSQTPKHKGVVGESKLIKLSNRHFRSPEYRLLNNVTLATSKATTQIDHILLSVFGVFVIETKNLSGQIFALPDRPMWLQRVGTKKIKFPNPLWQNYGHVKALESYIGLTEDQFVPLVVMAGKSAFDTPMPDGVVTLDGFIACVQARSKEQFSINTIRLWAAYLELVRLPPSGNTNELHISNVKRFKNRSL